MPMRAQRECKWGGCRAKTDGTYCQVHQSEIDADIKKANETSGWHRGERPKESSTKRGYGHVWIRFAKHYLAHNPYCAGCGVGFATQVDHIVPHHGDDKLFWDEQNVQGLCRSCHAKKSARERRGGSGEKRAAIDQIIKQCQANSSEEKQL